MTRIALAAVISLAGIALYVVNAEQFSSPTGQLFLWVWLACVLVLAAIILLRKPWLPALLLGAATTGAMVVAVIAIAVTAGPTGLALLLSIPLAIGQVTAWTLAGANTAHHAKHLRSVGAP